MELNDQDMLGLINGSAKGDTFSCQKLYDHLVDKVYVYVRYRTSTNEQATDLTQDVFIDFFAALPSFFYQSRAQLYAYVFVITRRKLARHYADANMQMKKNSVEFDEEFMSLPADQGLSDNKEVGLDVKQALGTLDEQTREIVVLHHWSRYTFGEIARLLKLTESAVRVRHHRALKTLAGALEK
ncbi:hypothetical protein A2592_00970 [Candidatus Kaiserbacteria bacterium RIFOXYD1_FULL_42_15]|uniref:RNA polymerase sigma factor 70 region 4 type 2 domain-containing protein n=1 Tax=Candidatus Kaiserbacteria bacterium RIFOXYD1_FULL_42_15 TaxID=1798532 RepID=A0A1F6FPB0_9BACT|nr:MAG: hypothetical protein A2592_00970 [Candidatus Kaiserbacteria bacterium RIFOXYD1_FULL_42_15]